MENKKDFAELMAELTFELNKTCNEKDRYFASMFKISSAELRCLSYFRNTNRISVSNLCKLMKLTPGRMTRILRSLEDKNLIVREIDRNDRRSIVVALASRCLPYIKSLNESNIKLHADILSVVEPEKRAAIISSMEELIRVLKTWTNNL